MNKTAIKNFAVWARRKLISEITYKAGLLGITEKGTSNPLPQSTKDLQFFDIGTRDYTQVTGNEITQRNALVFHIKEKERSSDYKTAFQSVVEEVAYTWFNRLIAVRFMEVNEYLPSRIRVLSSENPAKNEPDFVTAPFDTDLKFSPYERDRVMQLKDENKLDELFRMLFIKQCNKLNENLPELFEKTNDFTELLLTISFTDKDGVVYHLAHDIDEDDFNVSKEGQVEIIGWLYQYYNTEPKDEVFSLLKKNIKISKERIPAATQLFTPDWIVRYMVENSLGRLWINHLDSSFGNTYEINTPLRTQSGERVVDVLKANWKYYLEEAQQEPEVELQLEKILADYRDISLEDIKVIDPCMGSGHILVYAFDVLLQIYKSCGYTARDASKLILEKNLYGLDIDDRAYQLAYFAVMMKARQYNRRILNGEIKPNLYSIQESNFITDEHIEFIANGDGKIKTDLQSIRDDLHDAKEYGSILNIAPVNFAAIYTRIDVIRNTFFEDIFGGLNRDITMSKILPLVKQAEIMAQKYDVVVTNPPYMGSSGMSGKLSDFVKINYPNTKSDMSTVCMEKTLSMCNTHGYMAMINIPVWMFLSSYENLRVNIINNNSLINMIHFGRGVFGSDFGTTSFVISCSHYENYVGTYRRLFQKQGAVDSVEQKERWFFEGMGYYITKQENFSKIPGSPIAYWVSEKAAKAFVIGKPLSTLGQTTKGLITGNNDRFLRLWWEIIKHKINLNAVNNEDAIYSGAKWFPCNKGGEYRKWYGNNEYVINWDDGGREILLNAKNDKRHSQDYYSHLKFLPGVAWSSISSSKPSFRYIANNLIDHAGMAFFPNNSKQLLIYMSFMNSVVSSAFLTFLSPTINYNAGEIGNLTIVDKVEINNIIWKFVTDTINISKSDWDAFETSWDFVTHPLITYKSGAGFADVPMDKWQYRIKEAFKSWESNAEAQFNILKSNEEELNQIFIDIYGLQDELTPEVEDKDVTVRKADLGRDIRSFISYAVGCMFGRYSLDVDGRVYAGGEWDVNKYKTYIPDTDNCIPITDEEYFTDDIVGRFVEFVKTVYGKDILEENLDFIANALGNKGSASREVIRNYFLKDFYKDHCKIYQKRPIYWLFDSGKEDGFKALIYMQRYNADTIGNLRIEYLHRMQKVYESEISRMQETIDNSTNVREVTTAEKRKEKLIKQFKETKDYDAKIAHLALARIEIDLDDGVKVNYEKMQTDTDGKTLDVLAKI